MLEAVSLTVRRGARETLSRVSLALAPGEVLAVCGPNGAGKSTLLAALAGDLTPAGGEVRLDGAPAAALSPHALAVRRAVLEQAPALAAPFTARELAALGLVSRRPRPAEAAAMVERALAATGLAALAGRPATALSGGERARAHLARALVQIACGRAEDPVQGGRYLLLDEPTASLDLARQAEAMQAARRVRDAGTGVLAVLHDLNLAAAFADRVALLAGGRLIAVGPPAEVLIAERLGEVYGLPIAVGVGPRGGTAIAPDFTALATGRGLGAS
ncbi:heme ABC transporter ATP-binding protein [Albimonas sp. CAU 1670]|uniref:heme ABC transporter ATP-binding protein n=1 Tax=Albimonas sp. CAU 1670 TaxID=3032599 RepID=UPI0023DA52CA|nr:heme ABC transporter ATP-binding protein [Albimonas sp. CAU 1670]MDF2234139.1 heme ABC transporter ATP-binding protein [Albimonas sp. CAU 1670]